MNDISGIEATPVVLNLTPAIHRHFRLQWEPAQNAYVLLYPEGMVKLNQSAGEILTLCTGERSVHDIIRTLAEKFPEAENIQADIIEFFADPGVQPWLSYE